MRLYSKSKKMFGLAGLGALALVIAGCSPGTITARSTGSNLNPADRGAVTMVCLSRSVYKSNNCIGSGTATIDGVAFRTFFGEGGFELKTLSADNGKDCSAAPCPEGGIANDIEGNGTYGGASIHYTLYATDDDTTPTSGTADSFKLVLGPLNAPTITRTFDCTNCVEIRVLPGTLSNP
ncbi:MAG: hypothetical protein ACRDFX_10080 [Chloroflexota bacterium]